MKILLKSRRGPDVLPCVNDNFETVKDNILYYICGFIARNIFKKIDCPTCASSLLETIFDHNYSHKYPHSTLLHVKIEEGL